MKQEAKILFDKTVVALVRKSKVLQRIVDYTYIHSKTEGGGIDLPGHSKYCFLPGHDTEYCKKSYGALRNLFLNPLNGTRTELEIRAEIVERFERIDREVDIKSSPVEGLYLAEAALSIECDGAIVECGCYTGGSTAKLSILADVTGRDLVAFDSFEGLPVPGQSEKVDQHMRRRVELEHEWVSGEYSGSLDAVKSVVSKYGSLSRCRFVKGWFENTLATHLPDPISLAFVDVDLASSAGDCIRHIWPRLAHSGIFFTHDVSYVKVLQSLMSESLWRDEFKEHPPILYGAGFGLGDAAAHIGFAVKGNDDANYIKAISLSK
jgi:O-methyltransferase